MINHITTQHSNAIIFPKGNTHYISLCIHISGEHYILNKNDVVYFTVKIHSSGEALIQKKLTSADINENNELILALEPADTANLHTGDYIYDATVILDNEIYTFITPSLFKLTDTNYKADEFI